LKQLTHGPNVFIAINTQRLTNRNQVQVYLIGGYVDHLPNKQGKQMYSVDFGIQV